MSLQLGYVAAPAARSGACCCGWEKEGWGEGFDVVSSAVRCPCVLCTMTHSHMELPAAHHSCSSGRPIIVVWCLL
jgi:hypothetical protein